MTSNKPTYLIIHHTGGTDADPLFDTSNQSFEVVNNYHKQKWGDDVKSSFGYFCGYHYFIDKSGRITQARADLEGGAHTIGMNYSSIGICMAGNFDLSMPTKYQIDALTGLISKLQSRYLIPSSKIVPHRTFAQKSCYGHNLTEDWARVSTQARIFPDPNIRGMIGLLVRLKYILIPQLQLIFGSGKQPLNDLEAPCGY